MSAHDESMLDSVAVLALGALPAGEAASVAQHVAACEICRREFADLRVAADLLGYAAELRGQDVDELGEARLKARVMSAVRATVRSAGGALPAEPATSRRRSGPATSWLGYGAAAAAVVFALVSVGNAGRLKVQNERNEQRIASLEQRASAGASAAVAAEAASRALDNSIAALLSPHGKHYRVPGGEIVTSDGRVVIALHDVPPPPSGKVYQAWTLARGAKAVAPSITFSPDARGVALIELPVSALGVAAVAVSVEPQGGSKAPTTKPAFVRPLS